MMTAETEFSKICFQEEYSLTNNRKKSNSIHNGGSPGVYCMLP